MGTDDKIKVKHYTHIAELFRHPDYQKRSENIYYGDLVLLRIAYTSKSKERLDRGHWVAARAAWGEFMTYDKKTKPIGYSTEVVLPGSKMEFSRFRLYS